MFNRFVTDPVAPRAMVTVPVDTECDWLAVLVKVAYVPRPARLAAVPTAASDISVFDIVLLERNFIRLLHLAPTPGYSRCVVVGTR
jgi:hypothetical protein